MILNIIAKDASFQSPHPPINAISVQKMHEIAFRTTAHQTESDLRAILRKFISIKNEQNVKSRPLLEVLSEGKEELLSLKRKLSEKFQQQYSLYDNCKKRIHRHQELKSDKEQRIKFDFNSHIIQYLHSKKQLKRAKLLARALNEEIMFELETQLLKQALNISADILDNKLDSLRQWMRENSHNLDKSDTTIHFELTCCDFISFIEKEQPVEACNHLRQRLINIKLTKHQHKVVAKLTYLLIDSTSTPPNLNDHLNALETTFKKAFFDIYLINFDSHFQKNLIVGISSLKTVCCSKAQSKNHQICPVCTDRTSQLAERIPMLTKQSSSLKCRINQSIMDEENYPIALPSGNIYSVTGLNATSEDEQYYCINTETWYPKSQAKKVFLA